MIIGGVALLEFEQFCPQKLLRFKMMYEVLKDITEENLVYPVK